MGLNLMKLLQAAISICWTALWVLKLWEACMQHLNEKVSSATSRPIVSTASSPQWTARRRDFFKRKIYSCKPQSEKAKMWITKIKCTFCRLTKSSSIKIIWERDWMMRKTNCNKAIIAHPKTGDQTATTCKCQWRIIVLYSIRESQAIPELDCEISTLIWRSLVLLTTTSTTPRSQALAPYPWTWTASAMSRNLERTLTECTAFMTPSTTKVARNRWPTKIVISTTAQFPNQLCTKEEMYPSWAEILSNNTTEAVLTQQTTWTEYQDQASITHITGKTCQRRRSSRIWPKWILEIKEKKKNIITADLSAQRRTIHIQTTSKIWFQISNRIHKQMIHSMLHITISIVQAIW